MRIKKEVKVEVVKEIVYEISCDVCKKNVKKRNKYISICVSNGHYHDSGYETYEFCSKECFINYIKKMKLDEIDLMFSVDVYTFER